MKTSAVLISVMAAAAACAAEPAPKFAPNPKLAGIPAGTAMVISEGYKGDHNVLDYSGIVYDQHRHKLLAFGGGHATAKFPSSVHEFDLDKLEWRELIESVPPSEYTRANAVLDKDGKALGGVKYKGRVQASSRHTYDGLVMALDKDVMLCLQKVGEIGGGYLDGKVYTECYKGTGLWAFDPVKREWSVSKKSGLAMNHVGTAIWPKEPDWVYLYAQTGEFRAVNWRTEEVRDLGRVPRGMPYSYAGLEYWPDREALVAFPKGPKDDPRNRLMCKYDLAGKRWDTVEVQGDAPDTYDINVVYDARSKAFVCCSGGSFFYYLPGENRWHKAATDASLLKGGVRHRHAYDPVNNVHVVVGGRWKTVAFKLADDPAKLPLAGAGQAK
jgi:hypothetical protein